MKVENWFPWYGLILFSYLTIDLLQQFSLSCHCMESEGENSAIFCFTESHVRLKERIHRTWKVLTGIWFMTPILLYPNKSTQHPARSSSMWYAWNVPCIFAVWAYMFKNWSLKINRYHEYSVYSLFSLCALLDNGNLFCETPDATWRNLFICWYAIEVMLNFAVFLIFIRYAATVLMKSFYDEAVLKTHFQTLLRFSAGIG